MSGRAKNVVSTILKDTDRDFIVRISTLDGTSLPDFTPETLLHIASPVINFWGAIPSSLLNGHILSLEMRSTKKLDKGTTKSKKGRKRKKKNSTSTSKRNSRTSKGAGKKANKGLSK